MPGHGLARDAEAGLDIAELAIAVRGLVEVHEIHVDLGPRQGHVGLGMEMEQRRLQRIQTGDPHLRGGEGVHPGDYTMQSGSAFASSITRWMASASVSTGCHCTCSGS